MAGTRAALGFRAHSGWAAAVALAGSPEAPTVVRAHRDKPTETEAAITLVIEHPDGRIEARKFRRSGDAVSFLNHLEL